MKKLQIKKMCTSVAIGFYLRDEEDFQNFYNKMAALSKLDHSIFNVYDAKPQKLKTDCNEQVVQIQDDGFDDEFVML